MEDAKDAFTYCDDLKWPDDNGKRLKPELLKTREGIAKEEALRNLENDLGGPLVDFQQISGWVESKKKKKYQLKLEQEKRIRAELKVKAELDEEEHDRNYKLSMERKLNLEKRAAEERIRAKVVGFH